MENNTSFDVTAAIKRWRDNLTQSPNFNADDLNELESHLRDSLHELETRGLSAEEAFTIATRRIGSGPALAAEFAKINGSGLWIDRLLWMVLGWASVSTAKAFITSFAFVSMLASLNRSKLPVLILAAAWVSPLVLTALVLKSLIRADGSTRRLLTTLLQKPLKLSGAFLLIGLLSHVSRAAILSEITGRSQFGLYLTGSRSLVLSDSGLLAGNLVSLTQWIVIALLILLLANRRAQALHSN